MSEAVALIVPCYNEANRLDAGELRRLVQSRPGLALIFVDDGSTDATLSRMAEVATSDPQRVRVLKQDRNRGKSEAVRRGLLAALADGFTVVGYADADLSTPVDRILDLIADMEREPVDVLLGSRVRLLGTKIERRPHRHYLGRIFATIASLALRIPVYDTQCGAKLLRATPALAAALGTPFSSRWIFDVELLGRLLDGGEGVAGIEQTAMREHPLREWRDVAGSKLRAGTAAKAGLELLALCIRRRHARRARPA